MVMQNGGIIFNVSHSRAVAEIIRVGRARVCACVRAGVLVGACLITFRPIWGTGGETDTGSYI